MIFRRIVAVLLILAYVTLSVLAYVVFAFSNTLMDAKYYEDKISTDVYEFVVNLSIEKLLEEPLISENFNDAALRREILTALPFSSFKEVLKQIGTQIQNLKKDQDKPIVIKLGIVRNSLLTLVNNLSFKIFESIKKCTESEIPKENDKGIPTCIPQDVEYNVVFAPIKDKMEKSIYFREQVQVDTNAPIGNSGASLNMIVANIDDIKMIVYGGMVALIVFIALLVYAPFSSILTYVGSAFLISGFFGVFMKYILIFMGNSINLNIEDSSLENEFLGLFNAVVRTFAGEIQRIALVSVVLGAVLILMKFFFRHKQEV